MTALEPRRFPLPEVGTLPKTMYASIIRRERYGRPDNAFQIEKTSVPALGPGQVLVYVMAAGINYNNVWAAMGKPVAPSPTDSAAAPPRTSTSAAPKARGSCGPSATACVSTRSAIPSS